MTTATPVRQTTDPILENHALALCEVGREFHRRGWSLATSSNYSVVVNRDPLELLVTASGKHKNRLTERDFVRVDSSGQSLDLRAAKASAETLLHAAIATGRPVGAILHTHSVWSTVLSERFFVRGGIELTGFEMLKGLDGVASHEHNEWLPIFDNTQDIPVLADKIASVLEDRDGPIQHGLLIRRHGLYTWGDDLEDARRHVETIEFLLECLGRQLTLEAALRPASDHITELV
jgi:methylthioribulose-1-phosphate dehydratase